VVVVEVAVDDLGELAFEAAEGFGGGLLFGSFALVVGAAGSGVHGLHAGGDVQGVVEGSVAGSGEAVAGLLAAGDLDRGGAGVAGDRQRDCGVRSADATVAEARRRSRAGAQLGDRPTVPLGEVEPVEDLPHSQHGAFGPLRRDRDKIRAFP
jgi:hypothetical protein